MIVSHINRSDFVLAGKVHKPCARGQFELDTACKRPEVITPHMPESIIPMKSTQCGQHWVRGAAETAAGFEFTAVMGKTLLWIAE